MKPALISYGASVFSVLAIFGIGYFFGLSNQPAIILFLYLLPVLGSAWLFGGKPAFVSGVLATILAFYSLGPSQLIPLSLFTIYYSLSTILIHYLKYSREAKSIQLKHADLVQLKLELAQAREEVKARDEFLSIASHELKSPLTAMLLQIQTALHNVKNVSLANFSVAKLLTMLESVEHQTTRLSKMISDLLNISLITTKKLDLEPEKVDLTELAQNVIDNFSDKLTKDGYDLQLEYDKPVIGQWDKVRIEQVITNLITNAIKYGDGKPIHVKIANSDNKGRISITDRGIGIPDEQQGKIFALFERADGTKKGYQGLGVGLYITDQIVKAHGGQIKLKSKPGSGSTFTVELPLTN